MTGPVTAAPAPPEGRSCSRGCNGRASAIPQAWKALDPDRDEGWQPSTFREQLRSRLCWASRGPFHHLTTLPLLLLWEADCVGCAYNCSRVSCMKCTRSGKTTSTGTVPCRKRGGYSTPGRATRRRTRRQRARGEQGQSRCAGSSGRERRRQARQAEQA